MSKRKSAWLTLALLVVAAASLAQVSPPGRVGYQGVVRDVVGVPLEGEVSMTFRFYSAPSGGTLLWEEAYDPMGLSPGVTCSGGLFSVALGDPAHRSGGSETLFPSVFANYAVVYLAVQVENDPEMTPRIQAVAAPYAVNAARLEGHGASAFAETTHTHPGSDVTSAVASAADAGMLDAHDSTYFLNTSSAGQSKSGPLTLTNSGTYGITCTGGTAGGNFTNTAANSYAWLGYQNIGVYGSGNSAGGHFMYTPGGCYANLGTGAYGIEAFGSTAGGYFVGSGASGHAWVGFGEYGIQSFGNEMGGYFKDDNGSGALQAGSGDVGVAGFGNDAGGYFDDLNTASYAYLAFDVNGVFGVGSSNGGYFANSLTGRASIGAGDYGVMGWGSYAGGHFDDEDNTSWADVSTGTYKIYGSGTVSFVQNHPEEKDRVIVYACPEGDEVATYTRGTARLVNGEARVRLGETFQWVTNPDLGLSAHVTPKGKWAELFVESLSTTELVVRSRDGASDAAFDYLVYGLRIGFEESGIVQEKRRESYIPSFKDHRASYAKHPSLRAFNAFERFRTMESSVRGVRAEALDLSRAKALKEAVHEYDPATDPPVEKLLGHGAAARPSEPTRPVPRGGSPEDPGASPAAALPRVSPALSSQARSPEPAPAASPAAEPRPAPERFPVCEAVEVGDLLVSDGVRPGVFCLGRVASDPGVVGIALEASPPDTADAELRVAVATGGIVLCRADATGTPIRIHDLLVASPLPGHAMKAPALVPGTVVGKALEPLEAGTGVIRILVMLR